MVAEMKSSDSDQGRRHLSRELKIIILVCLLTATALAGAFTYLFMHPGKVVSFPLLEPLFMSPLDYNASTGGLSNATVWHFYDSRGGTLLFAFQAWERTHLACVFEEIYGSFYLVSRGSRHSIFFDRKADTLAIDGKAYDLRKGRVFLLRSSTAGPAIIQVAPRLPAVRFDAYNGSVIADALLAEGFLNDRPTSP